MAATQLTGTLQPGQSPTLTGDVPTPGASLATTIANAAVTLAKMANLAANSVIGNATGSPATPTAVFKTRAPTARTERFFGCKGKFPEKNLFVNSGTTAPPWPTTTPPTSCCTNPPFYRSAAAP